MATRRRETKWSKVPCLKTQGDGQGSVPPDPEIEVLAAWPDAPPLYKPKVYIELTHCFGGLAIYGEKKSCHWPHG